MPERFFVRAASALKHTIITREQARVRSLVIGELESLISRRPTRIETQGDPGGSSEHTAESDGFLPCHASDRRNVGGRFMAFRWHDGLVSSTPLFPGIPRHR